MTLRAEMSRLRRSLPGLLLTRPYRFAVPVSSDLDEADRRLGADEQLLPDSVAPAIVEARSQREPRPGVTLTPSGARPGASRATAAAG